MVMPAPYSTDLRQRVIEAYKANEGARRQLAERFAREFVVCPTVNPSLSKYRTIRSIASCRWSERENPRWGLVKSAAVSRETTGCFTGGIV